MSKGETVQYKLVRSAWWVVCHANYKKWNCCEKQLVDAVTLHTHNFLFTFLLNKNEGMKRTDTCYICEFTFPTLCSYSMCSANTHPSLSIFSFTSSGGAFNYIVLKGSTLTYITMLINRTFPFCRRPQRATLSVSVAESPHSLGPIHVFPMLQFTHWIRLGAKKSVSVPIIIWQGEEAVWGGGWDT